MRTNIKHSTSLKVGFALLAAFLWHSSFLSGASATSLPSGSDEHYRDSLLRHISANGSASMGCYLSYPIGSSVLDENFGNNHFELNALRGFLRMALEDTLLVVGSIRLDGYCSPDGSVSLNDRLARDRAKRLSGYLRGQIASYHSYPAAIHSHGADWETLRRLIEETPYTWKNEALRIIDSKEHPDRKKIWLSKLDNGTAHRVIYDMYPLLRRVEVRVLYDVQRTREKISNYIRPVEAPFSAEELNDGVASPLPPVVEIGVPTVSVALAVQEVARSEEKRLREQKKEPSENVDPLFALKTNLLFDAMLAPNVELEVPLGKRWSVMGEYTFPWWLHPNDDWCMEMLQFGVEGRYWLGNREYLKNGRKRNLLTGWFAGVYAGGGYYDFQFNRESGYQGEFYIAAGVSGGYALRLSRRLNLEFSLGLGVLTTRYREYNVVRGSQGNELIRQSYGKFFWVGPTKAKVSLVWLLGNRKGGKQ